MAHWQLGRVLMVALSLLVVAPPSLNQPPPGCNSTCGNVPIPYPFGTGYSSSPDKKPCFLEPKFNVSCNYSQSQLMTGNIPVINITVQTHQMDVRALVSWLCDSENYSTYSNPTLTTSSSFSISSKENKFVTVGCDSYGYLDSEYDGKLYSTGCITRCYGNELIDNGTCSGIGCCRMDIPNRMRNMSVKAFTFKNSTEYTNCSYSFVVKQDEYKFSASHLRHFPYERLPLVLDWTVGNTSCSVAKSKAEYACRQSSHCDDKDSDIGYRCICDDGYEGNPYIGCTDIDECKTNNHTCISESHCRNINGSYECFCPHGEIGNGKGDGGCRPIQRESTRTKLAIGACAGFVALLLISWLYIVYQKRNLIKQREKFYRQNGGFILQQRLSSKQGSSKTAQIFTAEELKKATNNYDEGLIIGKGGFGIVFKGILADNKVVAIKKSRVVDQSQVEQFINEVIILSQINHRNVVKLLGCCLDIEVPLLVYEFINNGTLYDHLHNESKVGNLAWKTRLRIAIEVASALSYLHSDASTTIIHRDVKSANILLDHNYTAKVSDFGASRMVPIDQVELATLVQGTFGYLDPEYMQTSRLTEKSDVYSFGVVLVELLTGQKAHSFGMSEEQKSVAMHFLSGLKNDHLFEILECDLLSEENEEEIMEVAIIASKCLSLKGDERPSMKEIEMELKRIGVIRKHPWGNVNQINLEESQYLLHGASSSFEYGNSSNLGNYGYDSLRDHVHIALDVAR